MGRAKWKGPFIEKSLFTKNSQLNTESRKSTILPFLVGKQLNVHNGKRFINLKVTEGMLGHKLGEFISTRVKFFFKKIKNKKKV
jgi:ribosomal protein S19